MTRRMRSSLRSHLAPAPALVILAASACAGRGALEPAPTTITSSSNEPRDVPTTTGCDRACAHMLDQCVERPSEVAHCVATCQAGIGEADVYAACVEQLSCEAVARGLDTNQGPVGECWQLALKK